MIYNSWDIECDRLKLVIMGHFCPHLYPKNQNNHNFEKIIIILQMCTKNHNHMRSNSWDMEWERQNFCHFGPLYALLPPNNLENQNFEKMKNASPDVTISHLHNKNYDHMMYVSWDIECHRHFFLSFWGIFCSLTLLTTEKIKIFKKWKKSCRYYHFTLAHHKLLLHDVWFLRYQARQTKYFVILGYFLPFTLLTSWKNEKNLEISSFNTCLSKTMIRWCKVLEIWCATDGQTDGWKENVTCRCGCPM